MFMRNAIERHNARLPAGVADLQAGEDVFYICNTLVPEVDGSRLIGPLTAEELETRRQRYDEITSVLPDEVKAGCPFVVYRLTRIE